MLLDYVKNCFVDSKEANLTIDWPLSFKLINNEFKTKCNVTNQEDASARTFRVKNFLKMLPTYRTLNERKVCGIDSAKCPRCNVMDEDWEHLWVCEKNDDITSEYASLENSIHEILQEIKMNDSDEINVRLVEMKDALTEVSKSRSCIEVTENVLRELTRGIINEKWIKVCKVKGDKDIIYKIYRYMDKIQKLFWNKETIELEKIRGITKELKRIRGKKVIESEGDEGSSDDEGKNKNEKKIVKN
ncbi:uncharacterized protein OCT59_002213 [Rhizophagus irregularis]|uniref:uncharacterized protein n=1 Tax=Rhizophagus irregularis TaxID=588596 RepID=UPI0033323F48|nr:hypothetical protein OCT59_002213 [Rhizophagus irregularis]